MSENRRKRLSIEERKYIEEHCLVKTDSEIAAHLNRDIDTVVRYRKKLGVKKTSRGKINLPQIKKGGVSKTSINKSNMSESEKLNSWKQYFKLSHRYARIKDQMTEKDLEHYMTIWAEYHIQFEDMRASEEDKLDSLITIKMRMDDNRRSYKDAQIYESDLRKKLGLRDGERMPDFENESDRILVETLISNNRNMQDINKDYRELEAKFDLALKSMNATREQREAKEKIGGDTFFSLVNAFKNDKQREEAGKYNELFLLAKEKQKKEFKEYHTYADGQQDKILLDGNDYVK